MRNSPTHRVCFDSSFLFRLPRTEPEVIGRISKCVLSSPRWAGIGFNNRPLSVNTRLGLSRPGWFEAARKLDEDSEKVSQRQVNATQNREWPAVIGEVGELWAMGSYYPPQYLNPEGSYAKNIMQSLFNSFVSVVLQFWNRFQRWISISKHFFDKEEALRT